MNNNDLGQLALEKLVQLWQISPERMVKTDQGFDWWPGRFRVSIIVQPPKYPEDTGAWRIRISTEFLREVRVEDPKVLGLLLELGKFAPTYSFVTPPPEVVEKYGIPTPGTVKMESTIYLREDGAGWLPEFFGRLAILQPIDAERLADGYAQILGAQPWTSSPGKPEADDYRDELLGVAHALYVPAGRDPSRWIGTNEFSDFAERFAKQDTCFGFGDPNGMTLETPFGEASALILCRTDVPHPDLGSGLLATLQLPFGKSQQETDNESMWFNYFESISWTNHPQLGGWHPRALPSGDMASAHAMFFPNIMYREGTATNAALWLLGRARWARQTFWPDLEDLTMAEILERRFSSET